MANLRLCGVLRGLVAQEPPIATFEKVAGKKTKTVKKSKSRGTVHLPYNELKVIAGVTMKNIDDAIDELKDELKRLNGRIVSSDHTMRNGIVIKDIWREQYRVEVDFSSDDDSF